MTNLKQDSEAFAKAYESDEHYQLYREAMRADDAYQQALVDEYGPDEAVEQRYYPSPVQNGAIREAARVKLQADEALRVSFAKLRKS